MRKNLCICIAVAMFLLTGCRESTQEKLFSPDGHIEVILNNPDDGNLTYSINVNGQEFIKDSRLGFIFKDSVMDGPLRINKTGFSSKDEVWTQPWGENKENKNHYNEMAVLLKGKDNMTLLLRFRAFDDGVGFRYEYDMPGNDSLIVMDELTEFNFMQDGRSWSIPANFETYELLYAEKKISEVETANTPITFKTDSGIYASIHEAALYDFPEMTLKKSGERCFKAELAPLPDGTKAHVPGTFQTAWRTIQIVPEAVGLINSSLILNLNDPCAIDSTDWIKPMKYVGVWWGMHLGVESWVINDRHGATTENAKQYIDFAAAHNIEGVLFEGWNEGWESWGGRQSFDYTKPYADFDMDEIAAYAREKGIRIIGHHETGGNVPNYERQLDKALQWYADYGVYDLKTGYAGAMPGGYLHHSQYGVRHYQKVVETAAKYKVTVNAHEPIKDTGIRRTWPNMMSREGARGMEWNAWSDGNPPSHHEILPFTRLLGGPMDYTPGTFDILFEKTRNSPLRKKWNDLDKGNSRVNTTLAKQIANWVVLYSPVQMASDMIENYENHPAFQFFVDFDADCDHSEALAGEPGEYVVIMRRAGNWFYLGATTNEEGRDLNIPLNFLDTDKIYTATIYADGDDADWKTNPCSYKIEKRTVTSGDTINMVLANGGGQAISFIPSGKI